MSYFEGKKIPEGATHFWEAEGIFYKKINGRWYFFVRDYWDLSISADNLGFESKLTELPTQPIGQSYMPEVGEVCQIAESSNDCSHNEPAGHQVKVYSKFTDDRGVELFAYIDSLGIVGGVGTANLFLPIKTEAEKQAEAIYELVKDATDLYAACEILVAAGYSK